MDFGLDMFVPVHPRDINTIIRKSKMCFDYLPISSMNLLTNKLVLHQFEGEANVNIYDEDEVYPYLNYDAVKIILEERQANSELAGWYLQQFLKMAYAFVCKDDY